MNHGHGHVTPNPDGSKARCGGPKICQVCQREQGALLHPRNLTHRCVHGCPTDEAGNLHDCDNCTPCRNDTMRAS